MKNYDEQMKILNEFSVTGPWCTRQYLKEIDIILATIKSLNCELSFYKGMVKINHNLHDISNFLRCYLDRLAIGDTDE